MRLVEAGWDAEATRRPHGQRTTVVVHLDVESRIAALHLGPLLTDDERRYLTCDATCEVWFERHGQVVGCRSGHPHRRSPAASRPRTPRPLLCGPRLRRHPRAARPPPPALGRRRPHRTVQPRAGLPVSPPAAPSGPHHHHWTRPSPRRHRRTPADHSVSGSLARPPDQTPTRGRPLPRTDRRTRRLVVVPTIPTATTTVNQLAADPASSAPSPPCVPRVPRTWPRRYAASGSPPAGVG